MLKIPEVNLLVVCRSHFITGHISSNPEDPDFCPNQNLPPGTPTVKLSKKSPVISQKKSSKTDISDQPSKEIETSEVDEDFNTIFVEPSEKKRKIWTTTSKQNQNLPHGTTTLKISKKSPVTSPKKSKVSEFSDQSSEEIKTPELDEDFNTIFVESSAKRHKISTTTTEKSPTTDCGNFSSEIFSSELQKSSHLYFDDAIKDRFCI